MDKRKTILITGANGFLGSFLVRIFLQKDYNVIALVRKNADKSRLVDVGVNKRLVFYSDNELENIFVDHKVDFIAHTATCYGRNNESFLEIIETNMVFPVRLLELATKHNVSCFINADTFFKENMGLKPGEECYVLTKKTFLSTAKIVIHNTPVKFANLRIEQMYGPNDSLKKFVPNITSQLVHNEKISLTDGRQKRDFIFVEDVAQAFLALVEHYENLDSFEEFGIGNGVSISIKDFVEMIKKISGSSSVLGWGDLPQRKNEIMDSFANLSNNKKIKWKAAVKLDEGLTRTIEYYKHF